jgi:hypothetical protein
MISALFEALAALRVWIGLGDSADDRLVPSHGWLLPPIPGFSGRVPQLALSPVPAPSSAAARRRQ